MSENGSLNPAEQNDLLQQITLLLTHTLPPGWGECTVVHRSLGRHTETLGQLSLVTGPGLPAPFDVPAALGELFERLRAGMYAPGLGTWFTAPPDAAEAELRRFPRDAEHVPAWLAAPPAQGMRIARPFDGTAPDGRPEVRRPDVPGAEREAMVRYLEQAPIVLAARSYDSDALDPGPARNVPLTYHTDGTWIWPGAVGYYLRAHGVPPEPELAAHIRRTGFAVPDVADGVRSAAVAAITGSESS